MTAALVLGSGAFAPGGDVRALAIVKDGYVTAGTSRHVDLWDPETGERRRTFFCPPICSGLVARGDEVLVVLETIYHLELDSFTICRRYNFHDYRLPLIAVAATERAVLYAEGRLARCARAADSWSGGLMRLEGEGRVGEVPSPKTYFRFPGHKAPIAACALAPDAEHALLAGLDGVIRLFRLDATRQRPPLVKTFAGQARACGFFPTRDLAYTVGQDHVRVFDLRGKLAWSLAGEAANAHGAAASPEGLLAVGHDREIVVYDAAGAVQQRLDSPRAGALAFDRGRVVAACRGAGYGEGTAVEVFDLASARRLLPAGPGHVGAIVSLAALGGGLFASGGTDGRVLAWDSATGAFVDELARVPGTARRLVAGPEVLAILDEEGRVALAELGRAPSRLPGDVRASTLAFSPDGRFLAMACDLEDRITVLDRQSGELRTVSLEGEEEGITSVTFSADRLYALGARSLGVWSWPAGALLARRPTASNWFGAEPAASLTVVGRWLVLAAVGRGLTILDLDGNLRERTRLNGEWMMRLVREDERRAIVLLRRTPLWAPRGEEDDPVLAFFDVEADDVTERRPAPPGALALASVGSRYVVGTSRGQLHVFDR